MPPFSRAHNGPLIHCRPCHQTLDVSQMIWLLKTANSQSYRFKSAHNAPECQMLHLLFRGVMVYVQRKASDVLKNRLYQGQMTVNASYANVPFLQYTSNESDLSLCCVRDQIAHSNESGTSEVQVRWLPTECNRSTFLWTEENDLTQGVNTILDV